MNYTYLNDNFQFPRLRGSRANSNRRFLMSRFFLLVALLVPVLAQADVKIRFTFSQLAGVAVQDGHTDRLPMASAYGVALAVPLEGFGWTVEGSLVTPLLKFTPAYRVGAGPVFPLDSTWSLGISMLYQYLPEYEDIPESSQQVGLGIGTSAKITDLTIGVGLAGWKVLGGGPWILAIQPFKVAF